jgi:hypothetical protein
MKYLSDNVDDLVTKWIVIKNYSKTNKKKVAAYISYPQVCFTSTVFKKSHYLKIVGLEAWLKW